MPEPMICREYSAERINAVINHPEVRPWVGADGSGPIDVTTLVADPRNVLLMADGGGFLLIQQEPGFYEVHTQFVPAARGEGVVEAVRAAERWMFTRTDCVEIRSKVPEGNVAAAALAKKTGLEFQFERPRVWPRNGEMVSARYYAKTLSQWANTAEEMAEIGEAFHRKLADAKARMGATTPIHGDDDSHDRYVGAAVEMIAAGQAAKGISFYNNWARFSGYATIAAIADNPLVIDIQDALLAVRDGDFEVILCR